MAGWSSCYHQLFTRIYPYKTNHHSCRDGTCQCQTMLIHDYFYHHCKTNFLGDVFYPWLRNACSRRCKILYDYLLLHHVALPGKSLHLPLPCMGIWTNCRMDWYVQRLDASSNHIWNTVSFGKVAESSCDWLIMSILYFNKSLTFIIIPQIRLMH